MSPIETSTKDGTSVLREDVEAHCSTARVLENDESQIEREQDHLKQEFSKLFHISQLLILLLPTLFEYFQVQDCSISTG
jgi:hypothetical protein